MYQIKLNYVAKKILIKITTNKIYKKKKKLSHKYIDPACIHYEQLHLQLNLNNISFRFSTEIYATCLDTLKKRE